VPPPFADTDDARSHVPFLPDTLSAAERPQLQATHVGSIPNVDGDLSDWPVVRWRDARGSGTLVRGTWSGRGDASMRFALLWSVDGVVLGVEIQDDSLEAATSSAQRLESALLYVGSSSDLVTRYWRSSERAFRV